MESLKLSERVRIALMAADRSRRSAVSRLLYSPLLRWRFGPPAADQLLIVPQDLRTSDASFWREVELGQFGLAGEIAVLGGHSPFDLTPPSPSWARELHGFGWLRNLEAAANPEAREAARRLVIEWAVRFGEGDVDGVPVEPAVAGRRIISWLSHANLLLEDAEPKTYEAITQALGGELVRLSASWRDGPDGYPRLIALVALTIADLCVAGHERHLTERERQFADELKRQILADGGHVSRNPGVLVELLLDLLPLKQCFATRARTPPAELLPAMQRMLMMLRYLRLGDGMLARFNGMSIASPAGLATVLAYDDMQRALATAAPQSHYVRLERGGSIVIIDTGAPPPLEAAGEAHAGCLSFEMSAGTELLVVNGGAPGSADADWRSASRATASHNTLCLADESSSRLVRNEQLEAILGAPPIRGPERVGAHVEQHGGNIELIADHNGYLGRFGMLHRRHLVLAARGRRLLGVDRLQAPYGNLRLRRDLPFAIHFHLHPDAACTAGSLPGSAEIKLKSGAVWSFSAQGADLSIEESIYFADSSGPRSSLQIVARGATFGESEVRWVLEALDGA